MDDQMNQMPNMPGSMPDSPLGGSPLTPPPPSQPPMGGMSGDPHEKIMASLVRIEGKLTAIASKVGA